MLRQSCLSALSPELCKKDEVADDNQRDTERWNDDLRKLIGRNHAGWILAAGHDTQRNDNGEIGDAEDNPDKQEKPT